MKKYLLPENGNFYKANLHSHSTVSDGSLTPEQMKKEYMEKGYSIIAYTDHNLIISHSELAEENFLPLNGFEVDVTENWKSRDEWKNLKTCHMCFIALEPDNLKHVCYHRELYVSRDEENYRKNVEFDENEPDFVREYTVECISEMMKKARDNGFFVTYNHPAWSLENYNEYSRYEHMHAMEICNYGCAVAGYADSNNERVYDDMLQRGKRIYCIGADDNHNRKPADSREYDSFGAFTMIKADKLEYKTITDAMLAGNFYASQGPEIYDLWLEDGKIHITCSDADRIILNTGHRRADIVFSENGKLLNEACFEVKPDDIYVRVTVIDEKGYPAQTNAYFTDELFSE